MGLFHKLCVTSHAHQCNNHDNVMSTVHKLIESSPGESAGSGINPSNSMANDPFSSGGMQTNFMTMVT